MGTRFEGTFTALVTPFREDGSVDWPAYERHVAEQVAHGVAGVVPCGTTGESPTLDHDEQVELVRVAAAVASGRSLVIAGTGTNATRTTIASSQAALRAGAHAVMVVVPYYNKPTQEGLREHYAAVASAVDAPLIVYNIPGRTGIDLSAETLEAICARSANVTAIKEATGNVLRAQEIARLLGDRITILSGDDALTLPMIAVGARGVISVTSNLLPAAVVRATKLALDGALDPARRAHQALLPVHEVMFVESNPAPVKAALARAGRMTDVVRPPLTRTSEAARARVERVVTTFEAQA